MSNIRTMLSLLVPCGSPTLSRCCCPVAGKAHRTTRGSAPLLPAVALLPGLASPRQEPTLHCTGNNCVARHAWGLTHQSLHIGLRFEYFVECSLLISDCFDFHKLDLASADEGSAGDEGLHSAIIIDELRR